MSLEGDISRALAALKAQTKPVRHIVVQRPKKLRGGKVRHSRVGPRGGVTEIQTILFPRPRWTEGRAKTWAREHNKRYGDVDVTESYIRMRQADPERFRRLRTICLDHKCHVKAVVGVR